MCRVALLDDAGATRSVGVVHARAVVLATGGYGQVFASTSNPPAVTGDGLALTLRAGLAARDVEFVQFHPSVLWIGPGSTGQQALVSEAVRGEGAILYDGLGRRVMAGVHPLEDLAPRDVVASAISRRMAEAPGGVGDHVFLDATHLGEEFYERFPSITAACRHAGIDPAHERIPVVPAAHYACGGVPPGHLRRRDGDGRGCSRSARWPARVCTEPTGSRRTQPDGRRRRRDATGCGAHHWAAASRDGRRRCGAAPTDAPLRNPAPRVEIRSGRVKSRWACSAPPDRARRRRSSARGLGPRRPRRASRAHAPRGRRRTCSPSPPRSPRRRRPGRRAGAAIGATTTSSSAPSGSPISTSA